MEKNSTPKDFPHELEESLRKGEISPKVKEHLLQFYTSYKESLEEHQIPLGSHLKHFRTFLHLVKEHLKHPFSFAPYHERIRTPFDHYAFGLDFVRPLVDPSRSTVVGTSHLDKILEQLEKKENVVFLANHQTEADPQAISVLLEKTHPKLAEEMIFVAGERVTTDPVAVPFSMGRNLLCIYSKRYIDYPPKDKLKKQLHNKRTMELMSELLAAGGKSIYVAPSGGRDRQNQEGVVEVAPFDPQSIEMFYLMAKKAGRPTHFYPMALATYNLLPPPETIQKELGEVRRTQRGGIHLAVGAEIDMEHFPGADQKDKHARREARASYIWSQVVQDYTKFPD